uniref:ZAD domain-containing protein n=1 Tax=Anopheles christyi TaxID=43041 RepID=A0A240PKS5_9DIPT
MAKVVHNIHNICRLCLTQDENLLRPVTRTLDTCLTIEDVERFTGIRINLNGNVSYAFCFACTHKLKDSVDFRKSCLDNNDHFQTLQRVLLVSAKGMATEEDVDEKSDPLDSKCVVLDDDESNDNDDYEYEYEYEDDDDDDDEDDDDDGDGDGIIIEPAEGPSRNDFAYTYRVDDSESNNSYVEPPDYSANYIEPCAESQSDSNDYEPDDFFGKKNEPYKGAVVQPAASGAVVKEGPPPEIRTKRTRNSYRPHHLCTMCGKLVTNVSVHISSVHKQERVHACPHCPAVMTHKGNLVKHIHSVHLKLICKTCKLCGKGFTHGNSLISHMLSHHGIGNRHQCTVSQKQFNTKSALGDHMRRAHSNARPLECGICGKRFKVRRALVVHKRVHSNEQPYGCSKCSKRFKSSYARKIHELTHSGVVFECELCDKSYRYKALLSIHMRKVHPYKMNENEHELAVQEMSDE